MSARRKASTRANGACRPATQSNTAPVIAPSGMADPVEKVLSRDSRRTLPRRSARPGSSVTRYVVLARKPLRGSISIPVRRHRTRSRPSPGETITMPPSPASAAFPPPEAPAPGCSLTTSSKRNSTDDARTFTAPDSGLTRTTAGAALSGGPPGGVPGEAQPAATSAADTRANARTRARTNAQTRERAVSRTVPPLFPATDPRARSIPAPSLAPPRRRRPVPAR